MDNMKLNTTWNYNVSNDIGISTNVHRRSRLSNSATVTYWPAPHQMAGHEHQRHTWQLAPTGIAFHAPGPDASLAGHLIQVSWNACGVSRLSAGLQFGCPFGVPAFSTPEARARQTEALRTLETRTLDRTFRWANTLRRGNYKASLIQGGSLSTESNSQQTFLAAIFGNNFWQQFLATIFVCNFWLQIFGCKFRHSHDVSSLFYPRYFKILIEQPENWYFYGATNVLLSVLFWHLAASSTMFIGPM